MIKKYLTTLFCVFAVQSAFALENPHTDSYGTWVGIRPDDNKVILNQHGFQDFHKTNLQEKCHGKLYYRQRIINYSGKKLLKNINESINMYSLDDETKSTVAYLKKLKTRINQNQKYNVLRVDSDCGDGYEEFVFLSSKEGILIQCDGDESYTFMLKSK